MNIAVRHGQLFVTEHWRVRREVLDEESLHSIDQHTGATTNEQIDRAELRLALLRKLGPTARRAVEALLRCPDLLT